MKNPNSKTADDCNTNFRTAFNILCMGEDSVSVEDMMEYLNVGDKAIYKRVKALEKEFYVEKKRIYRQDPRKPLRIKALKPRRKNSSTLY